MVSQDSGYEEPDPLPLRRGSWMLAVSGVALNAAIGSIMVAGLGPQGREFGMTDTQSGLVIGIGSLVGIVAGPLWGQLCSRHGHRWFLVRGLTMLAAVAAGFAAMLALAPLLQLVWIIGGLIALRVTQSLVGAALLPSTQCFVGQQLKPEARVSGMGLMTASLTAGALAGLLIMAQAGGAGLSLGLVLLSAIAVIAAICTTAGGLSRPPVRAGGLEKPAPLTRRLAPRLTVTFLVFLMYVQMQSVVGIQMMDRFGLGSDAATALTGATLAGTALSILICQLLVSMSRHWNVQRLMIGASAFVMLGALGFAFSGSVAQLAASVIVVGAALGTMLPPNFAALSLLGSVKDLGAIFGINTAARGLGVALGPFMGISLHAINPLAPILALTACAVGLCAIVARPERGDAIAARTSAPGSGGPAV